MFCEEDVLQCVRASRSNINHRCEGAKLDALVLQNGKLFGSGCGNVSSVDCWESETLRFFSRELMSR